MRLRVCVCVHVCACACGHARMPPQLGRMRSIELGDADADETAASDEQALRAKDC